MDKIFSILQVVLSSSEKVSLTIEQMNDGELQVIVAPELKEMPDDLSDKKMQLRAALGMPLVIKDKAETLDNDFLTLLSNYASKRNNISNTQATLAALDKVTEEGENAVKKSRDKSDTSKKTPKAAESGVPKPAPKSEKIVDQKNLF